MSYTGRAGLPAADLQGKKTRTSCPGIRSGPGGPRHLDLLNVCIAFLLSEMDY